jgi:hypothetical protein
MLKSSAQLLGLIEHELQQSHEDKYLDLLKQLYDATLHVITYLVIKKNQY